MIQGAKRKPWKNAGADIKILSYVVLGLAVVAGIVVRWGFISEADFPTNDGGFFYSMISDLIANNFRLPEYTSYNLAEIPFAYPPLAFYLVGALVKVTGLPIIKLLQYLPLIISVLTIPAFYAASNIFFPNDQFYRALASFLFATLPRSFEWFVMGGGITRSLGFLFALLAITFYAKAAIGRKIGTDLFLAGLFSSFTVLSHPVASIFLAFSIIVLTVYYWPTKFYVPLIAGALVLLITSPWWVTILSNNGLAPFIGASNTGHMDWFNVRYLLTQNFDFENRFFLHQVSFLAIMGLFNEQKRKALFLGILVGLGYLFVPRGGVDFLTAYLALLATLGFSMISEAWWKVRSNLNDREEERPGLGRRARILLAYLVIYTFIGAYSYKYVDGKVDLHLTEGDYQAMVWIKENTDITDRLIHLPPNSSYQDWWNDYFGEWMPALTERQNVATVQGYEWLPGEFNDRIEQYMALRRCAVQGAKCLEEWVNTYDNEYEYLLLSQGQHPKIVLENIMETSGYSVVYTNEDVVILRRD